MRNARWSNPSEVKRVLTPDKAASAGPVLYYSNGRRWTYANEGHTLFLGVSGAGKSRRGTIPMIRSFIEASESFIAVDPKGEIHQQTACYLGDAYDVHVIDFRHVFESERWNPLASCYELYQTGDAVKKQTAIEMVDDLAYSLYPTADRNDPFWINSARSVFVACATVLFEHAEPEQATIANAYHIIAKGDERWEGAATYLKRYVEYCPPESVSSMLLQSYVSTASDTRAGIRSTFLEGISMFARSEGLISMMSSDDLHINSLDGEAPTAIYIILPDESPIYDAVAGILCGQLLGHYVRLAQDRYDGKLPRRLNVCLEELGNIGKSIRSLAHLMSAGRSRNIRCQLVLQSLAQLDTLYGPSEAATIRSNADVLVAFRTNHWETLTELSHKCGEREVEQNGHFSREPLISAAQLGAMKTGQALVMISGATQFISWLPDYTELFDCSEWRKPERIARHEELEVSVFDIRELAKELKGKKDAEEAAAKEKAESNEDAIIPVFRPSEDAPCKTPAENAQDLLERIEEQIAKIEREEAKADEKESGGGKYEITLVSDGGRPISVFRVMLVMTDMKPDEVSIALDSLPYTIGFESRAKAETAYQRLSKLGAVVTKSF